MTLQVRIEAGLASCDREPAGRYPMGVSWRHGKFFRKGCGRRRCSTKVIVRAIRQTVEKRGAPEGLASSKGACGGAAVKMDEKRRLLKVTEGRWPGALELPIAV